jgi:hypothetical protein
MFHEYFHLKNKLMKKRKIIFSMSAVYAIIVLMSYSLGTVFKTNTGNVSFFSETPAMNIEANSQVLSSIISPDNNTLAFSVQNTSFHFKNALMEEHFNEKYIESDKYPRSSFSGKINEQIDLRKEGVYKVTATGKLNIHGVEQLRTISGDLTISKNKLHLNSSFMVKLVDHKIEVPTLVFEKVAEEIKITVDSDFTLL